MAVSGNTRHPEYRKLTLLYEFQKLKNWTRRSITPTDIDGRFLIHNGDAYNGGNGDWFLWLDLKTTGTPTSKPQQDAFDALLRRAKGMDMLVIAQHKPVEKVEVPDDIVCYAIRMYDIVAKDIAQTKWMMPANDRHIGWWIQQWFDHCENRANHFVTAFRQLAGLMPISVEEDWQQELNAIPD